MSVDLDDGVVKSYRFDKSTDDRMQNWIDASYFESDADIAHNAYQILFKIMEEIEKDKKVINFNTVVIGMQIDVPPSEAKSSLQ